MQVLNEPLEMVSVEHLTPHPRNPRRGDLSLIRRSIESHGWYGAIVVQRSTGHILAGNHRYLAARELGVEVVPVLWVDVDDQAAERILLVDNRSSDLATYDDTALAELLQSVLEQAGDLESVGYTSSDLDRLLKEVTCERPDAPPAPEASDGPGEREERFEVLVVCRSDEDQARLLERLASEGFECRALVA